MKVAIVGTSANLTENEERDLRQSIAQVLKPYDTDDTVIISGGGKGVDVIAVEIAEGLGFDTVVYYPRDPKWNYYKKRNLQIAEECDVLYCFSIPVHKIKCYHHDTLMDHEKTAGCWTLSKVYGMGKFCKLVVVPTR